MTYSVPCSTRRQAVDFHLTFPVPTLSQWPARAGRVKGAKRRSEPLTRPSTLARFGGGIGLSALCQGLFLLYRARMARKIRFCPGVGLGSTVGSACSPTVALTPIWGELMPWEDWL